MADRDWLAWHDPYDDPSSSLSRRLEVVQRQLAAALDRCADGTISILSMCAGQGRDLFGVLERHRRAQDVTARLVELDDRNVAIAAGRAAELDPSRTEVVKGDAGITDAYAGIAPATILLACGVFGNISDTDIATTVATLPTLCSTGATVIWTRHRRSPDLTPSIRGWFADAWFDEETFEALPGTSVGVGVHRLVGEPAAFQPGRRLFRFVGYDSLGATPHHVGDVPTPLDDGENDLDEPFLPTERTVAMSLGLPLRPTSKMQCVTDGPSGQDDRVPEREIQ